AIAILLGALALCEISVFTAIGTIGGITLIVGGISLALLSFILKCIKKPESTDETLAEKTLIALPDNASIEKAIEEFQNWSDKLTAKPSKEELEKAFASIKLVTERLPKVEIILHSINGRCFVGENTSQKTFLPIDKFTGTMLAYAHDIGSDACFPIKW